MRTTKGIRKVSRDIVMSFVHHVRDKVNEEDIDYIELGVDEKFEDYEALFKVTISKVLDIPIRVKQQFPEIVIMETLDVLNSVIVSKGYEKYVNDKVLAQGVYEVCLFILKKVKEEEFDIMLEGKVH